MCSEWYKWLESQGMRKVDDVFARLREMSRAIVGIEGHDLFSLSMPPSGLARVDLLIKAQGIHRDLNLYNHRIGAFFPGGNWTTGVERRAVTYPLRELEKLRLSLPCFVAVIPAVRHAVRGIKPGYPRGSRWLRAIGELVIEGYFRSGRWLKTKHGGIHAVGSLTNEQRSEAVRVLALSDISGKHGITAIPRLFYGTSQMVELPGTAERPEGIPLEENTVRTPPQHTWRFLAHDSEPPLVGPSGGRIEVCSAHWHSLQTDLAQAGLLLEPTSRFRFATELVRHTAILAVCGYGELTFRHGEALRAGRALVSQSISHAETMFPFEDNFNVVFVRPDLGDLPDVLTRIRRGPGEFDRIGAQGRHDWLAWSGDPASLLHAGVTRHVSEALERA